MVNKYKIIPNIVTGCFENGEPEKESFKITQLLKELQIFEF